MQALIRKKGAQPKLASIDEPEISHSDDVKIRIEYSTLCRDDMHVSDDFNIFGYGVIGHEASGVIVDAGNEAKRHGFLPGNRVTLMPFDSCGHCRHCLAQHPQYCLEAHLAPGVLAEYVVRKYEKLIPLPDSISFRQACLLEPVGDVLEALGKVKIDFSSEVLLVGAGFLGQVVLRILRMLGVKQIVVVEPIATRRQLALRYGADAAFSSNSPDLQVNLLKLTSFRGFDLVIDTSARSDIFDFALPCLTHGAVFLLLAYNDVHAKLTLPVLHMYSGNMQVLWSSLCGKEAMESAIHIVERLNLEDLITAEYPFRKSAEAYQAYIGTSEIKVGIQF